MEVSVANKIQKVYFTPTSEEVLLKSRQYDKNIHGDFIDYIYELKINGQ